MALGSATLAPAQTRRSGFNRVVATSSSYAFEFDNVAYQNTDPVPEPASLLLLGTGLIGVSSVWRKRRS